MWAPHLNEVTALVSRHPCFVIYLFMKSGFIALLLVFYFQLYSSLAEDYGDNKRWIFFCEEETIIDLFGLVQVLSKHDARKVAENYPWLLVNFFQLLLACSRLQDSRKSTLKNVAGGAVERRHLSLIYFSTAGPHFSLICPDREPGTGYYNLLHPYNSKHRHCWYKLALCSRSNKVFLVPNKPILKLQVEKRLELTLFWFNPSCFIM